LRFVEKKNSKPNKKTGQEPKEATTTKGICQWTQQFYHCATPQKPAKLIITTTFRET